MGVIDPLPWNT